MKHVELIPYDDNNIEHVMSGSDYGQIDSGSKELAWSELESKEYPDYVSMIVDRILNNHPTLLKSKLFH